MQKWEYAYVWIARNGKDYAVNGKDFKYEGRGQDHLPTILKRMGDEGWELVNSHIAAPMTWEMFFKRPAQE